MYFLGSCHCRNKARLSLQSFSFSRAAYKIKIQSSMPKNFNQLSDEVESIKNYLGWSDIACMQMTNRRMRELMKMPMTWECMYTEEQTTNSCDVFWFHIAKLMKKWIIDMHTHVAPLVALGTMFQIPDTFTDIEVVIDMYGYGYHKLYLIWKTDLQDRRVGVFLPSDPNTSEFINPQYRRISDLNFDHNEHYECIITNYIKGA